MKKFVVIGLVCFLLVLVACGEPADVKESRGEEAADVVSPVEGSAPDVVVIKTAVVPMATDTAVATDVPVPQVRSSVGAANVRSGPGGDFAPVGVLGAGEAVDLLGVSADGFWYEIELGDGTVGWVGSSVTTVDDGADLDAVVVVGETAVAPVVPTAANSPVPQETAVVYPTDTAVLVNSDEQPTSAPAGPSSGVPATCSCNGPDLDCPQMGTHAAAQACFDYCLGQGRGDYYRFDADNNGLACESLP